MKTIQIRVPEPKDLSKAAKSFGKGVVTTASKVKDSVALPFQFLSFSYGIWKGMKEAVATTQVKE